MFSVAGALIAVGPKKKKLPTFNLKNEIIFLFSSIDVVIDVVALLLLPVLLLYEVGLSL